MRKRDVSCPPVAIGPGRALQGLGVYVSCGITACGWGIAQLLEFDSRPYLMLWFAGAILAYNVDRLKRDPADLVNVPARRAVTDQLRTSSWLLISVTLLILGLLPLLSGNWVLLLLAGLGAIFCACYSLSPMGIRLKDLPVLKSFLAPTVVAAAFLIPPVLLGTINASPGFAVSVVCWLWIFLSFNMILCDVRDMEGDQVAGTRSLPVVIGRRNTGWLLRCMILLGFGLGTLAALLPHDKPRFPWITLTLVTAAYQVWLLSAPVASRTEAFYEWKVEGMLFLPALAAGMTFL